MPHFAKPFLMLAIENDFSNGSLMTRAKSRFETTKFIRVKQAARRAFVFNDLNTETLSHESCGGEDRTKLQVNQIQRKV